MHEAEKIPGATNFVHVPFTGGRIGHVIRNVAGVEIIPMQNTERNKS